METVNTNHDLPAVQEDEEDVVAEEEAQEVAD